MIPAAHLLSCLFQLSSVSQPASPAPAVHQPVDTLVRVGSHDLHLVLYRGRVPLTVLLEAGGAADLTSWADVPKRLADETGATVVAYDRAGLGGSGPVSSPGLGQPMVVVTAGKPWWGRKEIDGAWRRSHEAIAAAGKQRRLVVAEGSDHSVPEDRPEVISSARSRSC